MVAPIDFYFDFSSPYGYFGSLKIDEVGRDFNRDVRWRPILLGYVFKETGAQPLVQIPLKGKYALRDFERLARFMDADWQFPETFPIPTQAAARAFYWLDDQDRDLAKRFAKAAYHCFFGLGQDISSPEKVVEIASDLGVDGAALSRALSDPLVKGRVKTESAAAIEQGVCGSPYFIVDGEGFWGSDRLWMVRRWLKSGGW